MNSSTIRNAPRRMQMRQTTWRNPKDHVQRATLYDSDNRAFEVVWAPAGKTIRLKDADGEVHEVTDVQQVPSHYDHAIHRVDCGQDECHKGGGRIGGGWFCLKGHKGTIVGGLAPLLIHEGVEEFLPTALDPAAQEKKEAEALLEANAMAAQAAGDAAILAKARVARAADAAAKPEKK
jgi:hypothetical protein